MTKFGGTAVKTADDLRRLVDSKQPGDSVDLTLLRAGKTVTVKVELGTRPTA